MALPFITHQVFVVRPVKVADAHGNVSRTTKRWDTAPRIGPYPATAHPDAATLGASLPTREDGRGGREQIKTTIRVRFNPGVDVKATDGIEIPAGQPLAGLYEIVGDPLEMADPWGGLAHIDLKAVRIRG